MQIKTEIKTVQLIGLGIFALSLPFSSPDPSMFGTALLIAGTTTLGFGTGMQSMYKRINKVNSA